MKEFIYATCFWFVIAFVVVGLYNMERYDYEGIGRVQNSDWNGPDAWKSVVYLDGVKGLDFEGNYVVIHYKDGRHRAISNVDISWQD